MSGFLDELPEVFVSHTDISASVHQAVKQGTLRKIGPKLYTQNLQDDPEVIVRRNLYVLLLEYYPNALIADRSALENGPAEDGSLFIVSSRRRDTDLPGFTFKSRKGQGPLDSDLDFIAGTKISSPARAYLENMKPSRARYSIARTLNRNEVEEHLEAELKQYGDEKLNEIRDRAYNISKKLEMSEEYKKLDDLIGSLLGTRDADLVSETGKARQRGLPFDPNRVELFEDLFSILQTYSPKFRPASDLTTDERTNLSFFEAYFSNFIEGTEFKVEEAAKIVFQGEMPKERPEDAHDILGTYRIVSNYSEMLKVPKNFKQFIKLLKQRHSKFMKLRPGKNPGHFKSKENVAGSTTFVDLDLVVGTLKKGYEIYRGLNTAFARAVYMMFFVSEVHPFTDGNGRAARIMMNAELVNEKEQKIIIPTVYRNNYIASLRASTQKGNFNPLIKILDFAQKYTQLIDWQEFEMAREMLSETNAFMDPAIADSEGMRLRLPVNM